MKNIKFKDIFVPTLSLFLICLVVAFLLAGTNELTKEPIAQLQAKKADQAKLQVCPDAVTFDGQEETDVPVEFYRGFDEEGNLVGYAIPSSHKGYGGEVEIMVGISSKGEITGVNILSINETPGLGMNATKESFRNQFLGEIPDKSFTAKDDPSKEKIDALTGATITSEAVSQAVNKAIDVYRSLEGGGN
ncbi:MAG: RnfABCDGE type electron transport complex subunit G [Ruminococcus sp.]|nr:RnfABCDGE type electron transport complex subunit G [Ruminococcus sp.]